MTTNNPAPAPQSANFQDTLQKMWATRPPRIPKDQGGNAHIAGVCEGIGTRFQIDPTPIRILFVLSGLFGGGIATYFIAWLIMPRYSVEQAPFDVLLKKPVVEDKALKDERHLAWWLLIATVIFWSTTFTYDSNMIGTSSLFTTALACIMWFLLYQHKPVPPAGLLVNKEGDEGPDFSVLTPVEGRPHPYTRTTPPSWDPLGVAPFAWDLPEPGPAPAPAEKKSKVWKWIIGCVAAGVAVVMIAGASGVSLFSLNLGDDAEPMSGNVAFNVTQEDQIRDSYDVGIANTSLDFSDLSELSTPRTVKIDSGIGNLDLYLPTNVPVELTCDHGIGNSNCVSGLHHGGAPGPKLSIKLDSGIGNVTVHNQ